MTSLTQRTAFTAALVLGFGLTACTGGESNAKSSSGEPTLSEQAKDKASEMKADFNEKRAEYTKVAEEKLAKLDQRLAELRKSASEATGDAKDELEKLSDSLAEERKAVGAKLSELKNTSADAWSSFTSKLDDSMDSLSQSIERAFTKK